MTGSGECLAFPDQRLLLARSGFGVFAVEMPTGPQDAMPVERGTTLARRGDVFAVGGGVFALVDGDRAEISVRAASEPHRQLGTWHYFDGRVEDVGALSISLGAQWVLVEPATDTPKLFLLGPDGVSVLDRRSFAAVLPGVDEEQGNRFDVLPGGRFVAVQHARWGDNLALFDAVADRRIRYPELRLVSPVRFAPSVAADD